MPEFLFALAGAAVAVATYAAWQRNRARVVVTTVADVTVRGDRRWAIGRIVLVNAELLKAGEMAVSIGRIEIPRRQVAMIQIPTESTEDATS